MLHDTIAAIATAPGGAARGIVRLSGPSVVACVSENFSAADGCRLDDIGRPTAIGGSLRISLVPDRLRSVPCDLLLWPGSRSYTREPVAELHTVGSPPVLEAVLEAVCGQGARLAEPGEFTLRAFLAGRIDLTQAEAVLGVIDAEDSSELKSALAQLAGGLARPLHAVRDQLLQLLAEIEAGLDFVDEDIEFVSPSGVTAGLAKALTSVETIVAQLAARSDCSVRRRVVLLGPPNAGKSSLFNALVQRFGVRSAHDQPPDSEAIVSSIAGTTRDYLLADVEFDGCRFELVDTAGKTAATMDSTDPQRPISAAAQLHASAQARQAELRIYCHDVTLPNWEMTGEDSVGRLLHVLTKADLLTTSTDVQSRQPRRQGAILTSSATGQGLVKLMTTIQSTLEDGTAGNGAAGVTATATRCGESLRLARGALLAGHRLAADQAGDELVAAEIRSALHELGKVVGAVYTDDILDRVFSSFCIGK